MQRRNGDSRSSAPAPLIAVHRETVQEQRGHALAALDVCDATLRQRSEPPLRGEGSSAGFAGNRRRPVRTRRRLPRRVGKTRAANQADADRQGHCVRYETTTIHARLPAGKPMVSSLQPACCPHGVSRGTTPWMGSSPDSVTRAIGSKIGSEAIFSISSARFTLRPRAKPACARVWRGRWACEWRTLRRYMCMTEPERDGASCAIACCCASCCACSWVCTSASTC